MMQSVKIYLNEFAFRGWNLDVSERICVFGLGVIGFDKDKRYNKGSVKSCL